MKISNLLAAVVLVAVVVSCNRQETVLNPGGAQENPKEVMPKSAINALVNEQLRQNSRFNWKMVNDNALWSALVQGDSILAVGYQAAGTGNLDAIIDKIDIHSDAWTAARQNVLNLILENEKVTGAAVKSLITYEASKLPVFYVKASHLATVKALRASGLVRYAEPSSYAKYMYDAESPKGRSGASTESDLFTFGCDANLPKSLVAGVDYINITPAAKQSWNYALQSIPQAWTQSTGANVKVMLIDTGVSPDQANLGSAFNQGVSSGRTIEKIATYPGGTPADVCGHGTKMAGVIAAPRGVSGSSAGIAYNCNLITVHAADNVVIASSESTQGISDAYVLGGDNASVKIISMSMGTIFEAGQITDAVNYASNKGKLLFCAAGTTNSFFGPLLGVIYPAYLPSVLAVTGVTETPNTACEDCHSGTQVAFTVIMEKNGTKRNPLTTAATGNDPNTVGGSSVATASAAGIAALVWSKYPSYPKDSIVARLKRASSNYPGRDPKFGWGYVNVATAVGN
ncbi:S8 family serine peptidase [Chitinophaga qingshengii]|uniref:S8 family serine peptidase n=1 Tax=Chitinophaga qingshengii TaxID=1569794 RepID=A0ABR7TIC6_9BACT|nr:S8 family serine peptidase [Chitinophaga qingshengii]MBC9929144.1 S8 family serine peptidase [Chitinophaga qingshengii]